VRVLAEVLFARVAGRDLRFQVARFDLERSRRDPDTSVREFADARLGEPDALRVVHSTSWRHERGRIVLSYLVYSDRLSPPGRSRRARLDALPSPEEPARDARDRDRAVASHALRHLAFLVAEEPEEYRAKLSAATLRALRRLSPAAAGRVRHRYISRDPG
jgi:hypothetical protein